MDAVLANTGASLTFATVIVKLCSIGVEIIPSVTVNTTACEPATDGVPFNICVLVLKLSQDGKVVAAYVNASPSTSNADTV